MRISQNCSFSGVVLIIAVVEVHVYPRITGQRQTLNTWDDPRIFHYDNHFLRGEFRVCLGISSDPIFLWNT